jgi:hypothetical protein
MGPPALIVAMYCGWSLSKMFTADKSSEPPANVFPLYAPPCGRRAAVA